MSLSFADIDLSRITPMMQQYLEQKQKWPDCLLFFRLGDFYEMFFDDAVTASRELELALTGRDCGLSERAPMCGVPHHAAENYITRLVGRGYKVAICEQMEDPALAKGIVRREVIRVVTPGTVTDPAALDERKHNYMIAVYQISRYFGLAACDLTTGTFDATQIVTGQTEAKLFDEIARYNPSELLCNRMFSQNPLCIQATERYNITLSVRPDEYFSMDQVHIHHLEPDQDSPLWAQAAAALLAYLQDTQHVNPDQLSRIKPYQTSDYMNLDHIARRNLEITETMRDKQRKGSLLWAMDRTRTSMGSRLLRRWLEQPLLNRHDILYRQNAIEILKNKFILRQEIRESFQGIHDLERLTSKIALQSIHARDLIALRLSLARLPSLLERLQAMDETYLNSLGSQIDPLPELADTLERAICDEPPLSLKEGNLIRDGYHADVDRLRTAARDGQKWIVDLEAKEKEQSGIRSLKIGYNRVFGFYIEVTKSNLAQVPERYVRRQTLANAERYITQELKEMEDTILGAEQKSIALEYEVFCQIRVLVADQLDRLQSTARALAQLDVLSGLAELADREQYCRPVVDLEEELAINQGRHPVVEKVLGPGRFVPNDVRLDLSDQRVMILTGPNMAGKSTYMRQVAQIVLMAQIGSYVPAESAHIGIVDRIFTRVGASDDLSAGQSTFMVEMNEVAQILQQATPRSLLILDEIGRGTSTYDGLAIAWSVIEHVSDRQLLGSRTLFATHYHELTDLETILPGVFNCHVEVDEQQGEIVFLHKISAGGSDDSYGIEVARLAGVPDSVVRRAQEILLQLEDENTGRQRLKIRRGAKPMEGQMDLFSSAMAIRKTDELLERLRAVNIDLLRPLDAMNLLSELQLQVIKNGRGQT